AFDQLAPVPLAGDLLAGGDGDRDVLAQVGELGRVLGPDRVLDEERAHRGQFGGQLDGVGGGGALVEIHADLDVRAERVAQGGEGVHGPAQGRGLLVQAVVLGVVAVAGGVADEPPPVGHVLAGPADHRVDNRLAVEVVAVGGLHVAVAAGIV